MASPIGPSRVALAMDLDRVEALSADLERIAEGRDAASLMRHLVGLFKARVPHYHWVGIYLLRGGELHLGPFAGKPTEHTRIPVGQGVCGAAARTKQAIIVPDVNADERYLACSLETRSEIVVPILRGTEVLGEIDIDSDIPDAFNEHDQALLERAASLIAGKMASTPQSEPLDFGEPEMVS
ncbi:MAG TPA: GAF domain-containing protein [Terriglobales bacterium]|nr:GAF domain-containing protein [Terriglobales bacterium]